MFYQPEVVRSGDTMTFATTYNLDLPKTGILDSLLLYVRSTQNGYPFLTVPKWRLIDYISKIEVIGDGAEVLKSFDGRQALGSAFYDDGQEPPHEWRHYSNAPDRQIIPIHFGRTFYDSLLALDLSRFQQVTLKVTNDATSTQYTTNIQIDVVAIWQREGDTAPQGYLREEEFKVYAPAAATWEYTQLPAGLPLRRILLRGRPGVDTADAVNNSSWARLLYDIDFNMKGGVTRLYRGSGELLGFLSMIDGPGAVSVKGSIDRTAAYGFETGVAYAMHNMGVPVTDANGYATFPATDMRQDVQDSTQMLGHRAAEGMNAWQVWGYGYMGNVPLFRAQKTDLSDMLDPSAQGPVELDIQCETGTTVSGTDHVAENAIVLSRLVR